ncbi:MAG: DinB family protein [Chlorobia bacterium]|nr:DinB family protein [Fimbriimonadaceae bacterium]
MDPKPIAISGLKSACRIFLQDLQALPEEAFCKSFGDKVRTVADIVYEVNLVNEHVAIVIRGEQPFDWPEGGFIKAPEDFRGKDNVMRAFEASTEKILSTAETFSSEEFESPIQHDGGETTRFERYRFMSLHLWYHSGQLNFIQTLLGDDAWHWK